MRDGYNTKQGTILSDMGTQMSGRNLHNQTLQELPSTARKRLDPSIDDVYERPSYDETSVNYFTKKREYKLIIKVFRGLQEQADRHKR